MNQLVSILIPAYNAEKWIGACIESVLLQTWQRKEIIVVDDGSTDATYRTASKFASNNVRVVSQQNSGASAARNHALSLAQGDYIQWLDADDLLAPEKIEKQMRTAEKVENSDILFSCAWGKFYRHPELSRFTPDGLWRDLSPTEWLCIKLDHNLWMPPMVFLLPRKLSDAAGFYDETLFRDNDGEYMSRVIMAASEVRFVPDALSFKRSTFGISSTATLSDKKLASICKSLGYYIERLLSLEDSERTRRIGLRLLNRWAIYFYPERVDLYEKINQIADQLGGHLYTPKLRKKYVPVQKLFGWRTAKRMQNYAPVLRNFYEMALEHVLYLKRS